MQHYEELTLKGRIIQFSNPQFISKKNYSHDNTFASPYIYNLLNDSHYFFGKSKVDTLEVVLDGSRERETFINLVTYCHTCSSNCTFKPHLCDSSL